ncbi:hypothetical protein E3N88_18821 [Mikania micrantha]|uniref:Uncharacterized protein n=1 Tax=Mikania micrantha TaxID=192012 RepID=A0A5N6NNW5_9ASTR|nr:hypothetical protein E3N88_18821 [Mikania micrantha]
MVRTKQPTGKRKARGEASSSRNPEQPPTPWQRIDDYDEEELRPPSTLRLVGMAEGVQGIMSKENLNHDARFDTKPSNQYMYPSVEELYTKVDQQPTWPTMLQAIFEPGNVRGMKRNDLKIEAKLLLAFLTTNVIPRRADMASIGHPEVPILYALMTGKPNILFRYLSMMNIWEARNTK